MQPDQKNRSHHNTISRCTVNMQPDQKKSDTSGIWTHANEDNGLNVAP